MEQALGSNRLIAAEIVSATIIEVAAPSPTPSVWSRLRIALPIVLVIGCVFAGLGMRTFAYARNASLWIDEAMLALNVIHRTPAELLEPLDLNQGAPVGYLLLVKGTIQAFGSSEYALRLPSFLASLVGFGLFVPLAYRLLSTSAARIAVCLFALSPVLAGYAAEFKQYELDATLAIAIVAAGRSVWLGTAGRWRFVGLAALGMGAVWFSHPVTFVLGGVGLAALADALVRRDRAAFVTRLAVVLAWAGSFATCYLLFTHKLGMNAYLLEYWDGKFMPMPPYKPGHFAWIVNHFFEFLGKPGGLDSAGMGVTGFGAVAFLVGGLALVRVNWRLFVVLVAPLALALLASGVKKYPFAGRLMLYAVPAMILLVAYGVDLIANRLNDVVRGAGFIVIAVLFVAPVAECRWLLSHPLHSEEPRTALAYTHDHWQAGDRMYVFYGAAAAFAYYQPQYPFPADDVRFGAETRGKDSRAMRDDLLTFQGDKRVWVVIAHSQRDEEAALTAYLDGMGQREERIKYPDAVVLRYDLSAPPGPRTP